MHFVDDDGGKARLLGAIGERLKSGAILLLGDMFGRQDSPGFQDQMAAWRQFQEGTGIEGEDIDKGFRHVAKDIHTITEDRLSGLLHEAGFETPTPFFRALMFGGWSARKRAS